MRNGYRIFLAAAVLLALTVGIAGFAATEVAADAPVVHVVSWGDTLFSVATRYGTSVNALLQANHLRNADFIYIGQRLLIPGAAVPALAPASSYTVQAGDTLFSIATRYGTTVGALMRANALYNYWIYAGQVLRIPGQPVPRPLPPPPPQGVYYIVRPGDYLAAIAYRYGSSVYAIQIANNLSNASFIWIGQRLFIPGGQVPVHPPPVFPAPAAMPPILPVPPPVVSFFPPTATPPVVPVVIAPPPPVNASANLWEAVLITNTVGTGPCWLTVHVVGKTNWPVVVATTDGSFISDPKYTGTKPEKSPYTVEFAHSCTGTWRVIPLGLNAYADVTLNGGHAEVEFHPRTN